MPAVTVLMVCHRDTPFLRPAITSVMAQTFGDFELLLVDNGAGLTAASLGELGSDPRLRWLRFPQNLGIPRAHNAGIESALGEFVALLDHDDVMLPLRLEHQVALLRSRPEVGLVSSLAEAIDADGRVLGPEFALVDGNAQREYSAYAAPVVTPAYSGRRSVFSRLQYRAEFTLTADFDFLARAAEHVEFAAVEEVLLRYRRHASQATVQQAARICRECCVVRLLAARRRGGQGEGTDWKEFLGGVEPGMESGTLRFFAEQFLKEKWCVGAAYHARRSLAVRRTLPVLVAAIALFARAWWRAGTARGMTARVFFLGPVRALRLLPG